MPAAPAPLPVTREEETKAGAAQPERRSPGSQWDSGLRRPGSRLQKDAGQAARRPVRGWPCALLRRSGPEELRKAGAPATLSVQNRCTFHNYQKGPLSLCAD